MQEVEHVMKENVVAEALSRYIDRIEKLEKEKSDVLDCIKDVYAQASSEGFDTKVMRQIIRLRKMDNEAREEQEMLLELYKRALGMSHIIDGEET